ncbi:MAG: guanosine-3',5'-bis(diphosphate) 3'-pyrophosphohydrolase [Candidatus Poriferisodalaceae bacterium]|jgi:guanosine-3',5'-bis(diphosphate) 3'-pyrophosphohydrolase
MVNRVLPWRRSSAPVASQIDPVIEGYQRRWPKRDTSLILKAYAAANAAHDGQRRESGEAYILHPVAVARVVAEMGLDDISIAAALLHDAVEDTGVELADVERDFGIEVAGIVDGVTKLDRVRFETKEDQQAATLRKMLVAMARDMRVLLIKLSDRLHNMRTIGALKPEKQARIARETLDIYAPLAHRLGMDSLKSELEDLAFASLYPKRYVEIDNLMADRGPAQEVFVDVVLDEIRSQLGSMNINADVTGRQKHLWSLYEKMVVKGRSFDEIFDLVGVRVVVPTIREAYAALGSIHATWKPVSGRFKDYIAMPKFNLYQSLHTTVVGPGGTSVEVQIRTEEMHRRAEFGVAAHWRYKEASDTSGADVPWLSRIVDWQAETDDPDEFMRSLKIDLDQDEVYVFTPKGDVITLAEAATPIDFAYAIHTDVGHSTIGAKVDGRLVPLDRPLESGDTVEIFTSQVATAGPSRAWLEMATTPKAKARIRAWFNREDRDGAVEDGRAEVIEALRDSGLPASSLVDSEAMVKVAAQLDHETVDALFLDVGAGSTTAKSVAQRIEAYLRENDEDEQLPARPAAKRQSRKKREAGVHVEGFDDVLVRLARCCNPVRGDDILGFATRGRGVSVHRDDCTNAVELSLASGSRVVEVEWDHSFSGGFLVSVEVRGLDRNRLLADVVGLLSDHQVGITSCQARAGDDQVSIMNFELELGNPDQLSTVLATLRKVSSVFDAYRVMPGRVTS